MVDSTQCAITTYLLETLTDTVYSAYTGVEILIDSTSGYVKADTTTSFIKTVYLTAKTPFTAV